MSQVQGIFSKFLGLSGSAKKNAFWLSSERLIRVILSFVVGVMVVRYLGPYNNGVLQSGLAFSAIIGCIIELGMDSIIRRELVRRPKDEGKLLGSAAALRLLLLVPAGTAFIWLYAIQAGAAPSLFIVTLLPTLLAPVFQTYEHWFMAADRLRECTLAQGISLVSTAGLRLTLVVAGAGLFLFGWAAAFETVSLGIVFAIFYYTRSPGERPCWRFEWPVARHLLADSWPVLFTNVAVLAYRRCDILIVTNKIGALSAGLYASAVRLTELGYLVPMILFNAYLPLLIQLHHKDTATFELELKKLHRILTLFGIIFATIISCFSSIIVRRVLGPAFAGCEEALAIYSWTTIFVAQGIVRSIWLLLENQQIGGLILSIVSATTNFGLNLWLIPLYGIRGAAVAAVVALFFNIQVFTWLLPQTRRAWYIGWPGLFPHSTSA